MCFVIHKFRERERSLTKRVIARKKLWRILMNWFGHSIEKKKRKKLHQKIRFFRE